MTEFEESLLMEIRTARFCMADIAERLATLIALLRENEKPKAVAVITEAFVEGHIAK